jgi:hypothetical protein
MTTKKTVSHVTHTTHQSQQVEAIAPTAPVAATPAATTSAPSGQSVIFLTAPPSSANIPSPPKGFVAPVGAIFRGILPQQTELAVLQAAVEELRAFTDYSQVMGGTAPPATQVAQALDIGGQWTSMRNASDDWDGFCRSQEGVAWTTIRAMQDRLRPAWDLAVAGDPTLAARFPNLAALLGAKRATAKQGVATKALNKQAIAKGEPPTHGAVGKRRKRAAEKLAAQTLAAAAPPAQAAPVAQPAPVASAPAPVAPAAPPAATTSASSNGVAHS